MKFSETQGKMEFKSRISIFTIFLARVYRISKMELYYLSLLQRIERWIEILFNLSVSQLYKSLRADIKATVCDLLRRSPHVGRSRPPDVKDKRESAERQAGEHKEGTTPRGPPKALPPCVARVRRVAHVAGSLIKRGRGLLTWKNSTKQTH